MPFACIAFPQFLTLHLFCFSNIILGSRTFHHYTQLPFPWPSSSSSTSCSTAESSPSSCIHVCTTAATSTLFMPPVTDLATLPRPPRQVSVRSRPPSRLARFPPVLVWQAWGRRTVSRVAYLRASCPQPLQQWHPLLTWATVRSIGSRPIGIGTLAALGGTPLAPWLTGVALIAGCEVVHSDNSLTITIASAKVKGIPGCSFSSMRADAMIWSAIPAGSFEQYSSYRGSSHVVVNSFCTIWKCSEKCLLQCATSLTALEERWAQISIRTAVIVTSVMKRRHNVDSKRSHVSGG